MRWLEFATGEGVVWVYIDVWSILAWTLAIWLALKLLGKIAKAREIKRLKRERRAWLDSPARQELFDEWLEEVEQRKKRERELANRPPDW